MKKTTYVINTQFTLNHVMKIRKSDDVKEVILTKNCIDATKVSSLWYFKSLIRIHKRVKFRLTAIKEDWAVKRLLDSDDIVLI